MGGAESITAEYGKKYKNRRIIWQFYQMKIDTVFGEGS